MANRTSIWSVRSALMPTSRERAAGDALVSIITRKQGNWQYGKISPANMSKQPVTKRQFAHARRLTSTRRRFSPRSARPRGMRPDRPCGPFRAARIGGWRAAQRAGACRLRLPAPSSSTRTRQRPSTPRAPQPRGCHVHGQRQDPLFQRARAGGARVTAGARPLPLPDQGAGPGPARQAQRCSRRRGRASSTRWLQRMTATHRRVRSRLRKSRAFANQPRYADAGILPNHAVGGVLSPSALCGHRRGPLYRGVFGSQVACVLRRLRRCALLSGQSRAGLHRNIGHHRQPGGAFRAAHRPACAGHQRRRLTARPAHLALWNPPFVDRTHCHGEAPTTRPASCSPRS